MVTDHARGYFGEYRIHPTILFAQEMALNNSLLPDLLIHFGEESADYYTYNALMNCKEVWRVSEDGQLRDTFHHLSKVFEMPEYIFFEKFNKNVITEKKYSYLNMWKNELDKYIWNESMFPFSNIWIASIMTQMIPRGSVVHLGLSNTLRSWSFFDFKEDVRTYSNVGVRGIDGVLSTMIGASLENRNTLYFCILGDLTFFYDMNVLGNSNYFNGNRNSRCH